MEEVGVGGRGLEEGMMGGKATLKFDQGGTLYRKAK